MDVRVVGVVSVNGNSDASKSYGSFKDCRH